MQLETLIDNVINWSKERGIIPNATITSQFLKLVSEVGELAEHVNAFEDVEDDIGDIMVLSINILALMGASSEVIYNTLDAEVEDTDSLLIMAHIGEMADMVAKGTLKYMAVEKLLSYVYYWVDEYMITIEEALETAYNDIKDRKGFLTPEGVFVKDTDPEYQEIKDKYGIDN